MVSARLSCHTHALCDIQESSPAQLRQWGRQRGSLLPANTIALLIAQ